MSLLPQFGFIELLVIAIVALIVVGPKDLPKLMQSCGRFVAKARAMAGEFTSAFDEMARETEMDELRKELEDMRLNKITDDVKDEVNEAFRPVKDEINQTCEAGGEAVAETNGIEKSTSDLNDSSLQEVDHKNRSKH